jgi:hypothetical protein
VALSIDDHDTLRDHLDKKIMKKKWRDWLRGSPLQLTGPANGRTCGSGIYNTFFDDPSRHMTGCVTIRPSAPVCRWVCSDVSTAILRQPLVNPALGDAPSMHSVLNARNEQNAAGCVTSHTYMMRQMHYYLRQA